MTLRSQIIERLGHGTLLSVDEHGKWSSHNGSGHGPTTKGRCVEIVSAPRLLVGGRFTGPASLVVRDGKVVDIHTDGWLDGAEHLQLPTGS